MSSEIYICINYNNIYELTYLKLHIKIYENKSVTADW